MSTRPAATAATVAGHAISLPDVDARESALRLGPRARHLPPAGTPASEDARRWIVRELVTEAIVRHALEERGLPDLGALVEAVTEGVTVSDAAVEDYYGRNADRYRRPEARVVRLVPAPTGRGAADFGADTEAEVRRGELAGPFEDAIFAAAPGDIVGPFTIGARRWLARVERAVPARLVSLADVRAEIEADLRTAARARLFDQWLDARRAELARVEAGFEHPGDPSGRVPSHRH